MCLLVFKYYAIIFLLFIAYSLPVHCVLPDPDHDAVRVHLSESYFTADRIKVTHCHLRLVQCVFITSSLYVHTRSLFH